MSTFRPVCSPFSTCVLLTALSEPHTGYSDLDDMYQIWYYAARPHMEKKLPVAFYRMTNGREPVREWLKELPLADKRRIGADLMTVEYGWPIGMPLCRSMGGGLWEVRSNLPTGRTARILFCIADGHAVLLHGFIKKSQKTPDSDLDLARQRMKDVQS